MKKSFTTLSCLALGGLLLSPQMKAQKVDYTDYLVNPSFEYYVKDGVADVTDPIDVTNSGDERIVSSALRGTPPGWQDSGQPTPATGTLSYGINRTGLSKNELNTAWYSPSNMVEEFTLYQEVANLPAGRYRVSCRLYVATNRLANQRLFAETETTSISQYYGTEADYRDGDNTNIVAGETATFAGWQINSDTGDDKSFLRPLSVVIDVAEGETLKIGIKTSRHKKDGTTPTSNTGFYKVDDFHLTRTDITLTDDYTHKIANPSFELKDDGEGNAVQRTEAGQSIVRDTPYGWSDINRAGLTPLTGNLFYGVKSEANNADGAKSCWAQRNPFPDNFTLYQDITGLPAGKYQVSCLMFIETGMITTQRLFANNNVAYYGKEADYDQNLTTGEINTFAGLEPTDDVLYVGRFLRDMQVEATIATGETLKIGIKTSNVKKGGSTGTGKEGWFTVDNFRLKQLEDHTDVTAFTPVAVDKVEKSAQYYTLTGIAAPATAKGLLLKKITYTDGSVKVEKVVK